jgi:hypothetical protein
MHLLDEFIVREFGQDDFFVRHSTKFKMLPDEEALMPFILRSNYEVLDQCRSTQCARGNRHRVPR